MLNFGQDIAQIGGWLTKEEGEFLYGSAKNLSKNTKIVEIGSWKGRSTICFGKGAQDGSGTAVYAIDPHIGSSEHKKWFGEVNTYREFKENISNAGIAKYIQPIKKTSEEAEKDFIGGADFVFVDGAHEYEFVKKDFELWFPRLKDGGIMAFHDCWHAPGVQLLTAQILLSSYRIRRPKLLDTLTIIEKVKQNTILDRVYNFIFVLYRLFFGWVGTIKMDNFGTVLK